MILDTLRPILMLCVGSGMIFAFLVGLFFKKGHYLTVFVAYFSLFLAFCVVALWIVVASFLIAIGLVEIF